MTPALIALALAAAPSGHTHQRVIEVEPEWLAQPSKEDFDREYPMMAKARGENGRVVVDCTAQADGTLRNCVVVSETPAGEGFGEATLRLAPKYLLAPKDAKGRSVAGFRARLSVAWGVLS
jgi:protein TonB